MKQKQSLILSVSSYNPSLVAFSPSVTLSNLATSNQSKKINKQVLVNGVYNFINLNTIWWLKNSEFYSDLMLRKNNKNFIDGKILSIFLGIKQIRGPTFTNEFLKSKLSKSKKHFFIGLNKSDIKLLSEKTGIPIKKIYSYNPSYIKELEFSELERRKIINLLKKSNPNFVWVCVGSPKQEILANQLFSRYKSIYFNVGAALDFILGKKKESPVFFQKIGLEWFYRLITDFKYSKRKVWRHFVGLFYIIMGNVNCKTAI